MNFGKFGTMNRQRYTPKQIIAALAHTRGMVTLAAERLGCDPDTVHNYAKRYATVAEALRREREYTTDIAELKLFEAISNGESWALQFYLKTVGKHRGYVERQEITGKDGEALAPLVNVYLPSKGSLNAYYSGNGDSAATETGTRPGV